MILILPIISAFLHPMRDFILKFEKHNRDAIYIIMLLFWSFYGFILSLFLKEHFILSRQIFLLCIVSSFGNLIYFMGISRALKDGEFSILYPIIRSTPFVIAFLKWVFFGATYQFWFIVGIILVVYGVASIQSGFLFWKNFEEIKKNRYNILYSLLALTGGVIYYIADDMVMTSKMISPSSYLFYNFSICGLLFALVLIWNGGFKKEVSNLTHVLKTNGHKAALAGFTGFCSYFAVLLALKYNLDVVLVSALRLWGIPFAMFLGVIFLNERMHLPRKIIAVLIIFVGSMLATFFK